MRLTSLKLFICKIAANLLIFPLLKAISIMATQFSTLVVLTLAIVCSISALKLQLFDSNNFQGPYLTATNAEACTNLTTDKFIQEGRSLKTDTCIMIFKDVDCGSFSYRLDPGEYPDLTQVKHETINFANPKSYRLCSGGEGGVQVNVDIYGSAMIIGSEDPPIEGLLLGYRDMCNCINLQTKSPYVADVKSIHNFGNCVKLWGGSNCTGNSVQLLGGVSPQSLDVASANAGAFIVPSASIGLCEPRPSCHSLSTEVFKFMLNSTQSMDGIKTRSSDLAITTKTILRNNGSATVTQVYEAKKNIREVVEVSRVVSFGSSTNTYTTTRHVTYEYSGFWFWSTEKFSETVTQAYQSSSNATENGEKFISDESREISVRQEIELPPCSEYEVDSFITVVQNLPVEYDFYSYVSGYARDTRLSAEEVEERLTEGLSFVEKIDDFTIIAKGSGTIIADFSLEATIEGEGRPMGECQGSSLHDPTTDIRKL